MTVGATPAAEAGEGVEAEAGGYGVTGHVVEGAGDPRTCGATGEVLGRGMAGIGTVQDTTTGEAPAHGARMERKEEGETVAEVVVGVAADLEDARGTGAASRFLARAGRIAGAALQHRRAES